jgi:RNA polymerase sigma-70 factor (ECF subfamily)
MMRRIADGDQAAFAEVFQRTSAKLFGLCLRILPTRGEAEDALQDVYVTVWRRAAAFDRSRGAAWPWLITITRNCAIDRLRATRPAIRVSLDDASMIPDPMPLASDMLLKREQEQRLAECLGQLDERDAHLIRTAFLKGATYPELAQRLGYPLGTVKSRIRRALLRLRDCL